MTGTDRPAGEMPPDARIPRPVRGFVFDAVVALVLATVVTALLIVAGGIVTQGGMPPQGRVGTAWWLFVSGVGMGTAALVLYAWRMRATVAERAASWACARQARTWRLAFLVAGAVFAGTQALSFLVERAGWQLDPSNLDLIRRGLMTQPAFVVVFATLLVPAYEELLFRRVLLGRFLAAGRPWLGLVLSSALFALMHEIPGATANPLEATVALWLVYGGMGVAFGWLYWRTGTLWAPIAAHGLHNLASIHLLLVAVP